MRIRSILATTALAAAGTLAVLSSPAQADPLNCSSPHYNPDPRNTSDHRTELSITLRGRTIELRTGYDRWLKSRVAWAKMINGGPLDRIWIDELFDGRSDWNQCGPFFVRKRQFTPSIELDRVQVRACGDVKDNFFKGPIHRCTSWWS